MQPGYPAIGNEPDENFSQFGQVRWSALSQFQTAARGFHGELFERRHIDLDFALQIADADPSRTFSHLAI